MACRFGALSDPIAALEHAPRNPWRDYGSLMRKGSLTSWPGVSTSAKDGVAGQARARDCGHGTRQQRLTDGNGPWGLAWCDECSPRARTVAGRGPGRNVFRCAVVRI